MSMMHVYNDGKDCRKIEDTSPHFHVEIGEWFQPLAAKGLLIVARVDYHDPVNGILEQMLLKITEPGAIQ